MKSYDITQKRFGFAGVNGLEPQGVSSSCYLCCVGLILFATMCMLLAFSTPRGFVLILRQNQASSQSFLCLSVSL